MSEDASKRIDTIARKIGNDFDDLEMVDVDEASKKQVKVRNRVNITSKEFSKLAKEVQKIWNRYEEDVQTWKSAS